MVFLVRGGVQKTLKKRRKRTRKTLKNEEKEKRLWFYLLYKKLYFARNHSLEKVVYKTNFIYSFYALQDILNAVMIHQSSNGFA